jgi:hypothetical protein
LEQELQIIEDLLRRYDLVYEANTVSSVRKLLPLEREAALRELDGEDWWTGRRSISAVDLAIHGGFTSRARQDSRRLRDALIRIHDAMRAEGRDNPEAALIAAQFRKWLSSGID